MKKLNLFIFILIIFIPNFIYGKNFNDVDSHWAKNYIVFLSDRNVISGFGDGSFKPNNTLTKAQVIKMINKLYNFNEYDKAKEISTKWYYKDYLIALNYGYIDEDEVDKNIMRYELVELLGNLYDLHGGNFNFKDSNDINNNISSTLGALYERGILNGYEDGTFRPYSTLTRAEFCKIISLLFENFKLKDDIYSHLEENKKLDDLKRELNILIFRAESIEVDDYRDESIAKLNYVLDRVKNIEYTEENLTNAIKELQEAMGMLSRKEFGYPLKIIGVDEYGNTIPIVSYINDKEFVNGSNLAVGDYLLKVTSFGKKEVKTYIKITDAPKEIKITLKDNDNNKFLRLNLSQGLESESGYEFNKGDRVKIKIIKPLGMEVDRFIVNGSMKKIRDDEYIFIIKEDTDIYVSFKEMGNDS